MRGGNTLLLIFFINEIPHHLISESYAAGRHAASLGEINLQVQTAIR
jgi:hypothetical protein